MSLYFIFLRRAFRLSDLRSDPFWEFGSFGKTGCHSKNLLHPERCPLVDGDRLAFLQGGHHELRIVGVTPPIRVGGSAERVEVLWDKDYRPMPFKAAPTLINNSGETEFPLVFSALRLKDTNRSTLCGAAASRLRSRKQPAAQDFAAEILRWFSAKSLPQISAYTEAIEGPDGHWLRHAMLQGWAEKKARRERYEGLGDSVGSRQRCGGAKKRDNKVMRSRC